MIDSKPSEGTLLSLASSKCLPVRIKEACCNVISQSTSARSQHRADPAEHPLQVLHCWVFHLWSFVGLSTLPSPSEGQRTGGGETRARRARKRNTESKSSIFGQVDAAQGGLILMHSGCTECDTFNEDVLCPSHPRVAKYLSIFTHNIFSRCWTTLRGLQLQVSCYLGLTIDC